ncbi:hypothetical protein F4782DRAFT_414791 [Xylaria castorea]|nr:hypothetical protein F4782DRAFT_414791 [Xylaria castorea]
MNPNLYEMEGSMQRLVNHELESGNQPTNYNVGNPNVLLFPTFDNQLVPFESRTGQQELVSSPSHCLNGVISDAPNSSCRFRCEVLDDCAKARFYARALEFYLLDDEVADLDCLYAGCPAQNFKNSKAMLRHLKGCSYSDKGVFRCPLCNRHESFRVRSSSRCRWNKKHFGQKLKNIFRGFTGNRPETQKPVHNGLCHQCSAPLDKLSMQGAGHATQFIGAYPMQSTTPAIIPNQIELDMLDSRHNELDPDCLPSELSTEYNSLASRAGDSSSENSPIHPQPRQEYNDTYLGSEVSSAVVSLDGNIVNTDISPESSHHGEIPVTFHLHNSRSKLKRATRPLTDFFGEASSSSGIEIQRSASLYENVSTSHSLEPLNSLGAGTLIGSANLPTTRTPHLGPLKLRIDTSPPTRKFAEPALDYQVSLYSNQTVSYPVTTEIQMAAGLPTNLTHSQPSGISTLDTLPLGDDIFMAQSFLTSINPSPSASPFSTLNSQQTSPGSSPPEQEIVCPAPACFFKPTGRPDKRKSYLRKHMNVHKKQPSIPCTDCGATFTRHDNMVAHRGREHSTSPSKRRRGSSDSVPSPSQPKRRGAVRGRKPGSKPL